MTERRHHEIENFHLQCGVTLPRAVVSFAAFGALSPTRDNVVIYPTSYGLTDAETRWLVRPGGVLDPTEHFVVVFNQFGNGASTSPSTLPAPFDKGGAPPFTHYDNARAQETTLREVFGVERVKLAYGWSMGAQQCLHFGALFPDKVARIMAVCGATKTAEHAQVFVDMMMATLTTDAGYRDGWFPDRPDRGLRAFARAYAACAMSQTFYREELWRGMGYISREDYVRRFWEGAFAARDPANLVSMLQTWRASDISDNPVFRGDHAAALKAITARTVFAPCRTDFYFPPEDNHRDAPRMPAARVVEIDSDWGHRAGNPEFHAPDAEFLCRETKALLTEDV